MKCLVIPAALVLFTASCTLGPNYRRPSVAIPSTFRDVTGPAAQAQSVSLTDTQWFDLFRDDTLTQLVRTALVQNFDLRIAAERVLQARERFRIVGADRFPVVVGTASTSENRVSEAGPRPLPALWIPRWPISNSGSVSAGSWTCGAACDD
jgi:outer membrane protein TolC